LLGPRRKATEVEPGLTVVKATQTDRQTRLLVRLNGPVIEPTWQVTEPGLEDIILAYMEQDEMLNAGPMAELRVAR
jgi:ABC-2 type transport system ATP-binding protein